MYITRTFEQSIQSSGFQFPVLLLTGARQVGKTTLLRHLSEAERTYVSLDDPLVLRLAKEDPALFMQRYQLPILIDEIQYAPELLPYVKMSVDKNPQPGMFWLTGSQQFHLMKGVSESLAGRVGILQLLGLSRMEIMNLGKESQVFLPTFESVRRRFSWGDTFNLMELYRLIWKGAFPALFAYENFNRDLFYSSYVQTYLQRDIRDLARVGDQMSFLRFLRAAAARTGQLLNMADMARDADIAPNTAKSWLSILQASGIVYLLEPYHTNVTKRLVKTPKLYFLDTGLCAYLTEWSSPENLEVGAMSGAILETWIIIELLKSYWHSGRRAPFYYYRDKDKKEIDLLIIQDGTIYPIELKKTASPSKHDIRHFRLLDRLKHPVGQGGVICLIERLLPLTESVQAIPVSLL
ncbi:ATP-binding protein [candidate division CSSED10-310 bacterium]|uniref:ATP-binding protein n=1 Tax=candidate division CSSED10-310 bacterium TaxID=2855610 RepID=A0ABV6Z1Q1_UNCC1